MSIPIKLKKHRQLRHSLIGFAILLAIVAMYSKQVNLWGMAFIILNLYGWILILRDKKMAQQRSAFRIPEFSIFLVALCGGGLGAFLAMLIFRHKTKHIKFTLGLPVLMLTSVGLFLFGLVRIMPM